jgi:hypothetical protein
LNNTPPGEGNIEGCNWRKIYYAKDLKITIRRIRIQIEIKNKLKCNYKFQIEG